MNIQRLSIVALASLLAAFDGGSANAAANTFFVKGSPVVGPYRCRGPVNLVADVADENLHTTNAVFTHGPGGGEGGQFDRKPLLRIPITLTQGECLDAHFTAIVGGPQSYPGVSPMAMLQVALMPLGGGAPRHMYGHFETPYGVASPAVAVGPEADVDMMAANFVQHTGEGAHDVPPGKYEVDVWWSGSPPGKGAIGAAFVLKLYSNKPTIK